MKHLILVVMIGLLPSQIMAADDGTGWVMTRLDLTVKVDNTTPGLEVAGTIVLRLDTESSTGPVLWLNSRVAAMQWLSVSGKKVANVSLNGKTEDSPEQRSVGSPSGAIRSPKLPRLPRLPRLPSVYDTRGRPYLQ